MLYQHCLNTVYTDFKSLNHLNNVANKILKCHWVFFLSKLDLPASCKLRVCTKYFVRHIV